MYSNFSFTLHYSNICLARGWLSDEVPEFPEVVVQNVDCLNSDSFVFLPAVASIALLTSGDTDGSATVAQEYKQRTAQTRSAHTFLWTTFS